MDVSTLVLGTGRLAGEKEIIGLGIYIKDSFSRLLKHTMGDPSTRRE